MTEPLVMFSKFNPTQQYTINTDNSEHTQWRYYFLNRYTSHNLLDIHIEHRVSGLHILSTAMINKFYKQFHQKTDNSTTIQTIEYIFQRTMTQSIIVQSRFNTHSTGLWQALVLYSDILAPLKHCHLKYKYIYKIHIADWHLLIIKFVSLYMTPLLPYSYHPRMTQLYQNSSAVVREIQMWGLYEVPGVQKLGCNPVKL
jgi:hypothetical protein